MSNPTCVVNTFQHIQHKKEKQNKITYIKKKQTKCGYQRNKYGILVLKVGTKPTIKKYAFSFFCI